MSAHSPGVVEVRWDSQCPSRELECVSTHDSTSKGTVYFSESIFTISRSYWMVSGDEF